MCVFSPLVLLYTEQEHLIENEVSILRRVKHPNIIMLIEEMDTTSELYLVMELVKVSGLNSTQYEVIEALKAQNLMATMKRCFL